LLQDEIDWVYLLTTAFRHGLLPLLYRQLQAICPELVPPIWMEDLRDHFHRLAQRNLFLASELCTILEQLQADGVMAVPWKGPTLAASAYGNLALREFVDLDFLLREEDIPKAHTPLLALGYRPQFYRKNGRGMVRLRDAGQYPFTREDGKSLVELHSEITLRHFPVPPDLLRVWKRLESTALGGKTIPTLSLEDLLLFLCVHGAKDFWKQLKWICDISELVGIPERINWGQLLERAGRLGCEPMLFLGLYLASDLLGASLPKQVSDRVRTDAVKSAAAQVRRHLFQNPHRSPGVWGRWWFRVRMQERVWDGLRYCLRLAATPTDEDYAVVRLPDPLFPLYFVLRPVRLAKEYAVGLLRGPGSRDLGGFEPTPTESVERMLVLAQVGPADVVYDLGCGDGRLVIEAARRFGARGVGVDVDPRCLSRARASARKQGVDHLVTFLQQDAQTTDISRATVVLLYLPWMGNIRLRQMLREQLRPGVRLVSRDADMGSWLPDKIETIGDGQGLRSTLYLWQIQGQSSGAWARPDSVPNDGRAIG